jgi:hypothetical protein
LYIKESQRIGRTTEGSGFESPKGQEFFLLLIVQTGSVTYSASYSMGTGALLLEVKRPRNKADHALPTIVEVKRSWVYIHFPICLHAVVLN